MTIKNCSLADYYQILENISSFWGSDRTLAFHHPMFVYEFGNSSFVITDNELVIAYLFGFFSQTEKTGYIHLAGVLQSHQNKGLGSKLYNAFIAYAKQNNCNKLKAITTPANQTSINFHKKIGMHMLGEKLTDGINVVKNYSGIGQDRVVFEKEI